MRIQFSISILALLALAACGEDSTSNNEPGPGDQVEEAGDRIAETAGNVADKAAEAAVKTYDAVEDQVSHELDQFDAKGYTLRNMRGARVISSDDWDAGAISEVILGADLSITAFKLKEGTLLGFGGEEISISAMRFDGFLDEDGKVVFRIDMPESQIKALGEGAYEIPADVTFRMMIDETMFSGDRVLDAYVVNRDEKRIADIYDLVFTADNDLIAFVLTVGGVGEFGDRLVSVSPNSLAFNGDQNFFMDVGMPDLKTVDTFAYDRD